MKCGLSIHVLNSFQLKLLEAFPVSNVIATSVKDNLNACLNEGDFL